MNVPENLRYTKTHEWIRMEPDGLVSVGITEHAQERLGDMVFVQLPEIGARCAGGAECAVVESVKAAADVYAPASGEVVATNAEVRDRPQSINEDPYSAWLYRLRPSRAEDLGALLDAEAYASLVESGA